MNKNMCNNCGKLGHHFYQCKIPIVSYGIILFRYYQNTLQYLMIRRKNTFGFIDFIRGKYVQNNYLHLQAMFDEMSMEEKEIVMNHSFNSLWQYMWGNREQNHSNEEISSQRKFEQLKTGDEVNLQLLVESSKTRWMEPEWEFPKGRKNYQEKELECALREFEEETGISKNSIHVVDNLMPFEEMFVGSNHKAYKHKYFLAFVEENECTPNQPFQETEVSKIEWKTVEECMNSIRPYHIEKKGLIQNINKMLKEYRLYYGQ